jgi:hypothetical protein
MPVLYGVFLYMGIAALKGIQLIDRLLLILKPMKYQPDYVYLRHVPIRKVHLFTFFQATCLALLWIIKSIKKTKIGFPIMLVVMVGVRKLLEYIFSKEDLNQLDDAMPEIHLRKKDDAIKKKEQEEKKRKQKEKEEKAQEEEDEEAAKLRPVKTQGHLHIPMASGNVMKIPLTAISESEEKERPINISEEFNKSGVWRHIASESSFKVLPDKPATPPPDEDDEEFAPITIKIKDKGLPSNGAGGSKPSETQPLLEKGKKTPGKDEDGDKKQESSV